MACPQQLTGHHLEEVRLALMSQFAEVAQTIKFVNRCTNGNKD